MKKSKKILIADDDPSIVDALTLMLEFDDYEVLSTLDGSKVLEMQDDLPDLLLLDIWMCFQRLLNIPVQLNRSHSLKNCFIASIICFMF
jgi:DNA-binding response OmpR family regulator